MQNARQDIKTDWTGKSVIYLPEGKKNDCQKILKKKASGKFAEEKKRRGDDHPGKKTIPDDSFLGEQGWTGGTVPCVQVQEILEGRGE